MDRRVERAVGGGGGRQTNGPLRRAGCDATGRRRLKARPGQKVENGFSVRGTGATKKQKGLEREGDDDSKKKSHPGLFSAGNKTSQRGDAFLLGRGQASSGR